MDAFRILSRSTSQPRPPKTSNGVQAAQKQSRKNKRRDDGLDTSTFSAQDDISLKAYVENEFLGITQNADVSSSNGPNVKRRKIEDGPSEPNQQKAKHNAAQLPPKDLSTDRDELKSFLKKHKLKYTIISGPPAAKDDKSKKSKKSKKKSSKEPVLKDKGPSSTSIAALYPPLQTLDELQTRFKLSSRLYGNITKQGFTHPTEVQSASIPILMRYTTKSSSPYDEPEVDLMTVAPTGSGKTLAFSLPLVDYLIRRRQKEKELAGGSEEKITKGIKAVVLAPTRELADQIENEIRKLIDGTGIRVTGMRKSMIPKERRPKSAARNAEDDNSENSDNDESYEDSDVSSEEEDDDDNDDNEDGGVKLNGHNDEQQNGQKQEEGNTNGIVDERQEQKKIPALKTDILVSTPLLLLHAVDTCPDIFDLKDVTRLIFDEADVLLDPLFADQTLPIIDRIPYPDCNFSFWSATMPSAIEQKIADIINSRTSSYTRSVIRIIAGIKDSALPTISQSITYAATERGKLLALRQMFRTSLAPPCLIFVQTIPRAQALYNEILYDLPTPGRIAVLHSNLSDSGRTKVMDSFRAGEIWILITTDLLSRGVDFRGVNLVVNYDIPTSVASYIHRIGRTGRAGREGGQAVTYYTKEDVPYVRGIVGVIESSGGQVEKWMLDSLPKTTKEEKKKLKRLGVEERRSNFGENGTGAAKMRISSKSGYERQKEYRKKGAIEASKRRKKEQEKQAKLLEKRKSGGEEQVEVAGQAGYDSWEGFSD